MEKLEVIWGSTLMERGFTAVPNLLLDNYSELGITRQEALVIIHTIQRKSNEGWPFVSVSEIARKMDLAPRRVRAHLASLEKKGFLIREERTGRSSVINLSPLVKALEALEGQPEPTPTEPAAETPEPTPTEPAAETPEPTPTEPAAETPAPTPTEPAAETPEPTPTEPAAETPEPTPTPGADRNLGRKRPPSPDENVRPPRTKTSEDQDVDQDVDQTSPSHAAACVEPEVLPAPHAVLEEEEDFAARYPKVAQAWRQRGDRPLRHVDALLAQLVDQYGEETVTRAIHESAATTHQRDGKAHFGHVRTLAASFAAGAPEEPRSTLHGNGWRMKLETYLAEHGNFIDPSDLRRMLRELGPYNAEALAVFLARRGANGCRDRALWLGEIY